MKPQASGIKVIVDLRALGLAVVLGPGFTPVIEPAFAASLRDTRFRTLGEDRALGGGEDLPDTVMVYGFLDRALPLRGGVGRNGAAGRERVRDRGSRPG